MRIDPGNSNIPPASGRKLGRAFQRSASAPSSEQSSESTASVEIGQLMGIVNEDLEVRMELVEEVRQRLNRGEHLTRAAAEKTAEAILADLASFLGQ